MFKVFTWKRSLDKTFSLCWGSFIPFNLGFSYKTHWKMSKKNCSENWYRKCTYKERKKGSVKRDIQRPWLSFFLAPNSAEVEDTSWRLLSMHLIMCISALLWTQQRQKLIIWGMNSSTFPCCTPQNNVKLSTFAVSMKTRIYHSKCFILSIYFVADSSRPVEAYFANFVESEQDGIIAK